MAVTPSVEYVGTAEGCEPSRRLNSPIVGNNKNCVHTEVIETMTETPRCPQGLATSLSSGQGPTETSWRGRGGMPLRTRGEDAGHVVHFQEF